MTTPLIETLARAIAEADFHTPWPTDDYNGRQQKRQFMKEATAAIEAIKAAGYAIVPAEAVLLVEDIAAEACVPLSMLPNAGQPNGWRDVAVERMDKARECIAMIQAAEGERE